LLGSGLPGSRLPLNSPDSSLTHHYVRPLKVNGFNTVPE
jgi:hypothetical protein